MIDKLIMVVTDKHVLPYGTVLSVLRENINRKAWFATEAETDKYYTIPKTYCKEI